jgi:DNA repair protein RadC
MKPFGGMRSPSRSSTTTPAAIPTPSGADINFTEAVVVAGVLLDLKVLDHLVFC